MGKAVKRRYAASTVSIVSLSIPLIGPVHAAENSSGPSVVLESIVVTARKREELLTDVPFSLQVLDGEELSKLGAVNFADYGRTVAGVQFADKGAGRWTVSMRGVSTGEDVDTGKESTVAVYFDETPMSESSSQPDLKLFDIQRVEVLRGPQGTLFGSGSLSGAVRILPNQPNLSETEGFLQTQLSHTDHGGLNYSVNAMTNMPMSEKTAIRLVGYRVGNDGFLTNGFTGEDDINDEETSGGRVSLLFQPTESLEAVVSGIYQESHFGSYYQVTDHFPDLVIDEAAPEPFDDRHVLGNVKINYDFQGATLTSVTSYYDRRRYFENDIDFFTAFFGVPKAFSPLTYTAENLTQELRLASPGEGRFDWVVGSFFMDRSEELLQTASAAGVPVPPPREQIFYTNRFTDTRQYALFGEGTFDLTSTLSFTAGLRASRIDGDRKAIRDGFRRPATLITTGSSKDTPITPRFILSYQPDRNVHFFAQASRGFRIGGVNPGLLPCSESPGCTVDVGPDFDPDSTWNYEVGAKLQMLNDALSIQAGVFYIDWTDIQINVGRGDGTNGFMNAGSAVSKGVETAINARVNEHLQLGGQFTYTRAELTSLEPGVAEQGVAEAGDRLPQVPRISTSGYFELGTGIGDGRVYLRGDVQYVDDRFSNFSSTNPRVLDSYTLANLRLGFDIGEYTGSLFINNVTDKRANMSDTAYDGLHDGEPYSWLRRNVNIPRTYGVSIGRRF